jgi:hypothetical protein
MEPLPRSYDATRRSVHALAEHVLCASRYAASGRIGLMPVDDGIVTPEFKGRIVGLRGVELIDSRGDRRAPVSTLRAAARFCGVEPGAPPLWEPVTSCELDAPLPIDADGVAALTQWFAVGRSALASVYPGSPLTLWPEHFDLAITSAEGHIFGVSPGDATHTTPYLYVVPAGGPVPDGDDRFWSEPFGASLRYDRVDFAITAVAFFTLAANRLAASLTEVLS